MKNNVNIRSNLSVSGMHFKCSDVVPRLVIANGNLHERLLVRRPY